VIAINEQNMQELTNVVREACALGGIQLMKQANVARNIGKTPEFILAECIVAALRISQSMGDEPA
jgi:hypothetical protein